MKKMLFFLFLSISLFNYGQKVKIDSLELEMKKTKIDSVKINLLVKLLQKSLSSDINRGLPFADSLLLYAKREKNFKHISTSYRYIGNYYMYKGEYDTAIIHFNKSLEVNKSKNYANGLYSDNASLGNVYFYSRKYDSAEVKYNEALDIALNNKIKSKYTSAFLAVANVNYNSKNNEKAIEFYIKAIDSSIYLKRKDKKRVVPVYVNLGTLFLDRKEYTKSSLYLKQGYTLAKELNFKQGIGDAGLKLGRSYYENNTKLKESENILLNCIQIYKDLGDTPFLINSYLNLSDLYIITGELNKSIDLKLKAVSLAKSHNLKDYYYAATVSLAKSYYKNKNYQSSLKNVNSILKDTADARMTGLTKISLYKLKSDLESINKDYKQALIFSQILNNEIQQQFKEEKNKIVIDIQEKYETEKKEKENLQLKAEQAEQAFILEKETKQKWYLGLGLLASLFTLGVFGFYYNRNKKQKEVIENLQKELHHRIKNNLTIIDTFIEVTKEELIDKKFISKLNELQNRIESINEVHRQLYQNQDVTQLKLKNYIDTIAQNVQQSINNSNIEIQQNIPDNLGMRSDKSFPVGLIINEFLTNSFKYAFPSNQLGSISINLKASKKHYQLELSDNGIGLPKGFSIEKTESFGMRVMKLLTEQLKGTFLLENLNGVQLIIKFPKQ